MLQEAAVCLHLPRHLPLHPPQRVQVPGVERGGARRGGGRQDRDTQIRLPLPPGQQLGQVADRAWIELSTNYREI